MFEVDPSKFECICGREHNVSPELAGSQGRCVACGRLLRVPISSIWLNRADGSLQQQHYLRYFKVRSLEPGFAPMESQYSSAQLCTTVPGIVTISVWLLLMNAVRDNWDSFVLVVGGGSTDSNLFLAPFLMLATVGASSTVISVAEVYRRSFGNNYRDDRIEFAMVGGFDIARWVPVVAFLSIFGCYYVSQDLLLPDSLCYVRNPWTFLGISTFLSHSLAIYLSYQFFGATRVQGKL